jgi:preprotein translocase subunit SecD
MEFKLVDQTADQSLVANGVAPPGSQVLAYPDNPSGVPFIAVNRRVMVSGDELNDANQGYDQQTNAPVVNIRFNGQGGKKFGKVTTENVNKPFAIILDNVVLSAPNINEPILGGQAQISGNFTVKTANDLAVQLRSGKLPVALKVVDERSVGPDLGRDSIQSGVKAGIVATLALIIFMLFTYLRFGIYTTMALLVNGVLILGIMAMFNATLTLPGIAGFVLTIGAAVDANVLINERIREEIARGRQSLQAVEFGYKEAGSAIFDANVTNVISAIIMFWFGSGPIRGFAVVLAIGIVTSVFTGVTFTRFMVSHYLERNRPKELIL